TIDNQKLEWAPWDEDEVEAEVAAPAAPTAEDIQRLVDAVGAASRPLIVAGKGARAYRDELMALADATGALLATTLPGRGLFAGQPTNIGIVGSLASNLG